MKTALLVMMLAISGIAEAKLVKCTMTSRYNPSSPQIATGIIDTNDSNARIELSARNAGAPFATVSVYKGEALVNILNTEIATITVNNQESQYLANMPLTGNAAGYEKAMSATDANGVTHNVRCTDIR